jgi:hypothetical protein
MNPRSASIHRHLDAVEAVRAASRADPALAARLAAVKRYQGRRFERTYADWMRVPAARRACRFFLEELYGDKDFSRRDAEFARVVPALVRLFPDEITATVDALGALHALSEELDLQMARALEQSELDPSAYLRAWKATGRPDDRERQVRVMRDVGLALAAYTRRPMLRRTLKFMRAPAAAAGLSSLQAFLEEGFEAFGELPDPKAFLESVTTRERALMARLFAASHAQPEGPDDPLAHLP